MSDPRYPCPLCDSRWADVLDHLRAAHRFDVAAVESALRTWAVAADASIEELTEENYHSEAAEAGRTRDRLLAILGDRP